jgi:hypothetical protein
VWDVRLHRQMLAINNTFAKMRSLERASVVDLS